MGENHDNEGITFKNHCISIMWEDIAIHRDEEVNWYQLTPMELAYCKFDAIAKDILIFSVKNNWKYFNSLPGEGW